MKYSIINNTKNFGGESIKHKNVYEDSTLKNKIKNYKLENLTHEFIHKLRKNSIYRKPINY